MSNIAKMKTNQVNMFEAIEHKNLTLSEQESIIQLAREITREKCKTGQIVSSSVFISQLLIQELADLNNEVFGAVFLSSHREIISIDNLFQGTIDGASVYSRVVVQRVLECNAAAVIFYHNHPSGFSLPSSADRQLTKRLQEALKLIDVPVLDHLVVGGANVVSFAERGML